MCLCINIWHVLRVSFKLKRFLASCICTVTLQSDSCCICSQSLFFFPFQRNPEIKTFHMKIYTRFVKSTTVLFCFFLNVTGKMNIRVGVIQHSLILCYRREVCDFV